MYDVPTLAINRSSRIACDSASVDAFFFIFSLSCGLGWKLVRDHKAPLTVCIECICDEDKEANCFGEVNGANRRKHQKALFLNQDRFLFFAFFFYFIFFFSSKTLVYYVVAYNHCKIFQFLSLSRDLCISILRLLWIAYGLVFVKRTLTKNRTQTVCSPFNACIRLVTALTNDEERTNDWKSDRQRKRATEENGVFAVVVVVRLYLWYRSCTRTIVFGLSRYTKSARNWTSLIVYD